MSGCNHQTGFPHSAEGVGCLHDHPVTGAVVPAGGEDLRIQLLRASADDRLQRFMDDPEAYMAECRQRAREIVERDVQRDLARRRSEFWRRVRSLWGLRARAAALAPENARPE